MNISQMSMHTMQQSLRVAQKNGDSSLIDAISDRIEMIRDHRGFSTKRGGKRFVNDRDDD